MINLRLISVALILVVLPLAAKQFVGSIQISAKELSMHGVAQPEAISELQSMGFELEIYDQGSWAIGKAKSCNSEIYAIDPYGQESGLVEEKKRKFDHLDFLYGGKIYPAFPYLTIARGQTTYYLMRTIGLKPVLQPVLAIFSDGLCENINAA